MRSRGARARGELPTELAATYEFRVAGGIEMRFDDWFDAPEVVMAEQETIIRVYVADQSALHGAIATLRNLGLTLIAVSRCASGESPGETSEGAER